LQRGGGFGWRRQPVEELAMELVKVGLWALLGGVAVSVVPIALFIGLEWMNFYPDLTTSIMSHVGSLGAFLAVTTLAVLGFGWITVLGVLVSCIGVVWVFVETLEAAESAVQPRRAPRTRARAARAHGPLLSPS
jgi:hypothetical protein